MEALLLVHENLVQELIRHLSQGGADEERLQNLSTERTQLKEKQAANDGLHSELERLRARTLVGCLLAVQIGIERDTRRLSQAAIAQWYRVFKNEVKVPPSAVKGAVRSSQADHLLRMEALKALEKQLHRTLMSKPDV